MSDKSLTKGAKVYVDGFGAGEITFVDSKGEGEEKVLVYHVLLEDGQTRHFTADQLELE